MKPQSAFSISTLAAVLIAGACATVAFDVFGQSVSPMLGQPALAPIPLANAVIATLFGAPYGPGAQLLHYIAGVVAYPLGWVLVADPLARRLAPSLHWSLAAGLYGIVLWIFALYGMAHLVAGNPPFLGFMSITWVALTGHVLFALVAAGVLRILQPLTVSDEGVATTAGLSQVRAG